MLVRAVVTAALALCMGCSAAPDQSVGEDPEVVQGPPKAVVHEHEGRALQPAPVAPFARDFSPTSYEVETTSTVTEADGTVWTAGWFRGSIRVGAQLLTSRGAMDVFLSKTDARGNVLWVVSAGSPEDERNAKVSLRDDGSGNVALDALTAGRIDCGNGALQKWSESTYFFCRYRKSDGALVDGASFPGP
ncbi:MAG TPA: hypothetical protein VIF62_28000 [Labilithrix sp.]|jgi:hypothetical protein